VDQYRPERASYSPQDFVLWEQNGLLEVSPKFQRRAVWRTPARSFFIDTLLRGMTVPPIYLRQTQNLAKTKVIREVVDGQQRVRCVMDFINDKFRLAKTLKTEWAGKNFSGLAEEERQRIMQFSFPTETFKGITDKQVLEVFCRLNMNGVPLNKQELRNGKFFGRFKQTVFDLALTYLEFWKNQHIFSDNSIARMLEVELTSELVIAGIDGMQNKKLSIDTFYKNNEELYPTQARDEKRFNDVMDTLSETFQKDELAHSEFHRPPLFYTLYCVVYHHTFGLNGTQNSTPKKKLNDDQRISLREAVMSLSEAILKAKEPTSKAERRYMDFVAACQRGTDNINPRKTRFNSLYTEAF